MCSGNVYSPKIRKNLSVKNRQVITSEEVRIFLKNKRVILDCGGKFCLHNFSNTMIIHSDGTMVCHAVGIRKEEDYATEKKEKEYSCKENNRSE